MQINISLTDTTIGIWTDADGTIFASAVSATDQPVDPWRVAGLLRPWIESWARNGVAERTTIDASIGGRLVCTFDVRDSTVTAGVPRSFAA